MVAGVGYILLGVAISTAAALAAGLFYMVHHILTVGALILASGSATRAKMLRDAGVAIETAVPAIDEAEVKTSLRHDGAPASRPR